MLGAGGFLTGGSQSSDGTFAIRTDTYGGYVWQPNMVASNGATGNWLQTNTVAGFLANGNFAGQVLNSGIYEIQVAYSNSSIMYMETVKNFPTYGPYYTPYISIDAGVHWTEIPLFTNVTVTSSSGSVLTNSGTNNLFVGQGVSFVGSLGTCNSSTICAGSTYYVISTSLTSGTFEVSSSPGGSAQTPATSITATVTPGIVTNCGGSNDNFRGQGPKLAIDPQVPGTAYLGTPNNGLFYTSNYGVTWAQVSTAQVPLPLLHGSACPGYAGMVMDMSHNLYVNSYGNGNYKCTASTSCTAITGGPLYIFNAFVDYNTGNYYAIDGVSGGNNSNGDLWVYNGSWTETITGSVQAAASDPNCSGHIVAIDQYGNPNEIAPACSGGSWSGFSTKNNNSNYNLWRSYTNDIGWWTNSGAFQPFQLYFDRSVAKKLWLVANGDFWVSVPWSGNIVSGSSGTQVVWDSQGRGIEQVVANEVLAPQTATPVGGFWDFGAQQLTIPTGAYPATASIWPALSSGALAAVWSMDYCSSNPAYIFALSDGQYGSNNSSPSYSNNYGAPGSWTLFESTAPQAKMTGGNIACATPDNIFMTSSSVVSSGGSPQQPYYTTNFTTSRTWSPVVLPGVFNADTISSGTYNASTGAVSLTVSTGGTGSVGSLFRLYNLTGTVTPVSISSGSYNSGTGLVTLTMSSSALSGSTGYTIVVSGVTGTGSVASVNGTFSSGVTASGSTITYTIAQSLTLTISSSTGSVSPSVTSLTTTSLNNPSTSANETATTGTTGTTINYTAPANLGSITITGGNTTGWSNFSNNNQYAGSGTRWECADRATPGNFYLMYQPVNGGGTTTIFATINNGVTWVNEGPGNTSLGAGVHVECTPGKTADVWIAEGGGGNCCNQNLYASYKSGLFHTTNATGNPASWVKSTNIYNVLALGFGPIKSGNTCCGGSGYPEIVASGSAVFNSTSSVNVGLSPVQVTSSSGAILTNSGTNGFSSGQAISFHSSGFGGFAQATAFGGLTPGATYYVLPTNLSSTTFEVSATSGGAAITPTASVSAMVTWNESFNIGTGLTVLPNSNVGVQGVSTSALGNVNSYNATTGLIVVDITYPGTNTSYSSWSVSINGVWSSDDEGASWQELVAPPQFDALKTTAGDPVIWAQAYFGFSGSGFGMVLPYLLKRDIDPASNDNSPVGLNRAA